MDIDTIEKNADVTYAKGDSFEYKRVGDVSHFKFHGKCKSRRVIRELVKRLERL